MFRLQAVGLLFLCVASIMAGPKEADGRAGKKEASNVSPYVAVYRFYDEKLHEHIYACGDDENVNFHLDRTKKGEALIGYASAKPLQGTHRLGRAVRTDGLHYYFLDVLPAQFRLMVPVNVIIREENFNNAYVWSRKLTGMVAIHSSWAPDGTDMVFDPDWKKVQRRVQTIKQAAFYLYEKPPEPAKKPAPPMKK